MFSIRIESNLLAKLSEKLKKEDVDSCIRLREYSYGTGCNRQEVLALGMDTLDEIDQDEDIRISIDGVPFVASNAVLNKYGNSYRIFLNAREELELVSLCRAPEMPSCGI